MPADALLETAAASAATAQPAATTHDDRSNPAAEGGHPGLGDAFADLESLDSPAASPGQTPQDASGAKGGEKTPATPAKPLDEADKSLGEATKGDKAKAEAADAAKTAGAKPAQTDEDGLPKLSTPKELRLWAKEQARIAKEKGEAITKLEAKLKFMEERGIKAPAEEGAIKERLATLEKQLADKEKEIQSAAYERSDEYRTKFYQPYTDAIRSAYSDVEQLIVSSGSQDEGTYQERPATRADFQAIFQLPIGAASREARKLFGDTAPIVMQHYTEIKRLAAGATKAIEDHKTSFETRQKEEIARRSVEQEGSQRMWRTVNEGISKKFPHYFAPDENDPEGNALLEKGYQMVDGRFNNEASLTREQVVVMDATIRHRAAAFGRMAHRAKMYQAKVAALEQQLAEFKSSAPAGQAQRPAGAAPAKTDDSWESSLDSLG